MGIRWRIVVGVHIGVGGSWTVASAANATHVRFIIIVVE